MQIDDEAIALLRLQIEAEVAQTAELRRQNDLAEQAIKQAQADAQSRELADRNRDVADRNRVKIGLDTNERGCTKRCLISPAFSANFKS